MHRPIRCESPDCGSKFQPVGRAPALEQLRAAGWRYFDGITTGGTPLRDVRCPQCSRPDPVVVKICRELAQEVRS